MASSQRRRCPHRFRQPPSLVDSFSEQKQPVWTRPTCRCAALSENRTALPRRTCRYGFKRPSSRDRAGTAERSSRTKHVNIKLPDRSPTCGRLSRHWAGVRKKVLYHHNRMVPQIAHVAKHAFVPIPILKSLFQLAISRRVLRRRCKSRQQCLHPSNFLCLFFENLFLYKKFHKFPPRKNRTSTFITYSGGLHSESIHETI
jgi:hypothetical protein